MDQVYRDQSRSLDQHDGSTVIRRSAEVKRPLNQLVCCVFVVHRLFFFCHPLDFVPEGDHSLTTWLDPKLFRVKESILFRVWIFIFLHVGDSGQNCSEPSDQIAVDQGCILQFSG